MADQNHPKTHYVLFHVLGDCPCHSSTVSQSKDLTDIINQQIYEIMLMRSLTLNSTQLSNLYGQSFFNEVTMSKKCLFTFI